MAVRVRGSSLWCVGGFGTPSWLWCGGIRHHTLAIVTAPRFHPASSCLQRVIMWWLWWSVVIVLVSWPHCHHRCSAPEPPCEQVLAAVGGGCWCSSLPFLCTRKPPYEQVLIGMGASCLPISPALSLTPRGCTHPQTTPQAVAHGCGAGTVSSWCWCCWCWCPLPLLS
jgi:hypothetical protein